MDRWIIDFSIFMDCLEMETQKRKTRVYTGCMGTNTNELVSLHIFVIIIFCYHAPLVNFIQLAMQLQSQWSLWSSWLRTVDSSLAGNIWTPGQSLPVPIPSRARANADDNDDLYQSRPATEEGLSKKKKVHLHGWR